MERRALRDLPGSVRDKDLAWGDDLHELAGLTVGGSRESISLHHLGRGLLLRHVDRDGVDGLDQRGDGDGGTLELPKVDHHPHADATKHHGPRHSVLFLAHPILVGVLHAHQHGLRHHAELHSVGGGGHHVQKLQLGHLCPVAAEELSAGRQGLVEDREVALRDVIGQGDEDKAVVGAVDWLWLGGDVQTNAASALLLVPQAAWEVADRHFGCHRRQNLKDGSWLPAVADAIHSKVAVHGQAWADPLVLGDGGKRHTGHHDLASVGGVPYHFGEAVPRPVKLHVVGELVKALLEGPDPPEVDAHPDAGPGEDQLPLAVDNPAGRRQCQDLPGPLRLQQVHLHLHTEADGGLDAVKANLEGVSLGVDLVAVVEGKLASDGGVVDLLHLRVGKRLRRCKACGVLDVCEHEKHLIHLEDRLGSGGRGIAIAGKPRG
mmetsp:Transcript_7066/g.19955  ORF Transcript_7066/g.19955 Transcript_7066/m.19955 type:complete len:433 (-) Transcript_7066:1655-2953(-)